VPKFKKKSRTKEEETIWLEALLKERLEEDSRPGIPDIKQVELFSKWRKFVPEELQEVICPKPPD
jgi:hypothetical protein